VAGNTTKTPSQPKLSDFDLLMAALIGIGLTALIVAYGWSSATGKNDGFTGFLFAIGGLLFVTFSIVWAMASRPWLRFDDWKTPLYTGHDDHADVHADDHAADHAVHQTEAHLPPTLTAESLAALAAAPAPVEPAIVASAATALSTKTAEAPAEVVVDVAAEVAPAATTDAQSYHAVTPNAEAAAALADSSVEPAISANAATAAAAMATGTDPSQVTAEKKRAQGEAVASSRKAQSKGSADHDNFEVIEGIGPKIAGALYAAGVKRFAELSTMDPAAIEKIVKEAGVRMVGHAETFPQQAALAAADKWDELESLKNTLNRGH